MNNKRFMYFESNYYSLYIKLIIQYIVNKSIIVQVRD